MLFNSTPGENCPRFTSTSCFELSCFFDVSPLCVRWCRSCRHLCEMRLSGSLWYLYYLKCVFLCWCFKRIKKTHRSCSFFFKSLNQVFGSSVSNSQASQNTFCFKLCLFSKMHSNSRIFYTACLREQPFICASHRFIQELFRWAPQTPGWHFGRRAKWSTSSFQLRVLQQL